MSAVEFVSGERLHLVLQNRRPTVWMEGGNVSDAASYLNAPHPHPPLSANLLLSFTMKSTSCRLAGTVAVGSASSFFGFQWIFAILEPSGKGLPFPGMPDW